MLTNIKEIGKYCHISFSFSFTFHFHFSLLIFSFTFLISHYFTFVSTDVALHWAEKSSQISKRFASIVIFSFLEGFTLGEHLTNIKEIMPHIQ